MDLEEASAFLCRLRIPQRGRARGLGAGMESGGRKSATSAEENEAGLEEERGTQPQTVLEELIRD